MRPIGKHDRTRRCRALAGALLIAVLVASMAFSAVATVPVAAQEAAPLLPDLAAMTLLPTDLPEAGYALEGGRRVSLDEEGANTAAARGQTATPEAAIDLAAALEAAGRQDRYVLSLILPSPDDPGLVAVRVLSYVTAYATPEGAAAGFALTEDESAIPTASDVPPSRPFGDQTEVTRDSGVITDLDQPYRSLDLTFRLGNLTAGVLIYDNLDREPDQTALETLAETLLARIEAVLAGGGPELGNRAIRVGGNVGVDFDDENYERRAGQTIPYAGEAPDVRATREANYGPATDVYSVYQALVLRDGVTGDDPYLVTRLYRFPDDASASAWLAGLPERLGQEGAGYAEASPVGDATPVAGAPPLGDESLTIAYVFAASQTVTTRGTLVAVRVGSVVARVQVDAMPEPDPAAVRTLAELQAACLAGGNCPPSVPAPDGMLIPGPPPMVDPLDPLG